MSDVRARLRNWSQSVELRVRAVCLASRDPRVPAGAKVLAVIVAAYALSPIDLIPDFVPILGLLDDLVLVPLGIALVVRLVPRDVWNECLEAAQAQMDKKLRRSWIAGAVVVLIWIAVAALVGFILWHRFQRA